jgi:hypothetical protein
MKGKKEDCTPYRSTQYFLVTNFCTVATEGTFDCLIGSHGLCLGDFGSLSAWRPIIVTGFTGSSSVIGVPVLGIF